MTEEHGERFLGWFLLELGQWSAPPLEFYIFQIGQPSIVLLTMEQRGRTCLKPPRLFLLTQQSAEIRKGMFMLPSKTGVFIFRQIPGAIGRSKILVYPMGQSTASPLTHAEEYLQRATVESFITIETVCSGAPSTVV